MLHSMLPGLPPSAVVVLAGISGSGKSSWAAEAFKGTHVLSSDATRGVLTDEPEHQGCSHDAFSVLEALADLRLKYQRLAVIDATNLKRSARTPWLQLARKHDVPAIVIWFDTPPEVCARRQLLRDRQVPVEVIARQARALADLRPNLVEEGWDAVIRVHTAEGVEGVGALYFEAIREWKAPLLAVTENGGARYNQRDFDVIGDVHGCLDELVELMGLLGWSRDKAGQWSHPEERPLIFIGDLTDRGPDSLGVLALVDDLVTRGKALLVLGNHDDKLARWLRGNSVKVSHGLETTAAEFSALEPEAFLILKARYRKLFDAAPLWMLCDPAPGAGGGIGARVVIAHAAWMTRLLTANAGRVRSYCLYGPTTGNVVNGLPQRLDWKIDYPLDGPTCVVGHTAYLGPIVERNNTFCIDTACVFGGHLSALRWPSREIVQVPARAVYSEKGGLGETPNLVDPASIPAPGQAPAASLQGGKAPIPHSIAARVESMERIGPSKRFDLSFERLMTLIHEEPEAVLQAIHEDPLLLKRTPVNSDFSALTLSNASKLLFTPDAEHQVFAKGLIYLRDPWRAASIPYIKMYNYGEREDSFDLANTLAGTAGISVRFNEKLDGTMIQSFSTAGMGLEGGDAVIVTTRGMIEGGDTGAQVDDTQFDYIGQARAILSTQTPAALDPVRVAGLTLIWELIHPQSRIVTDYGARTEVILTGAVDFRQGVPRYIPRDELVELAADLGAPIAEELELPGDTLPERLEALSGYLEGTDREGAVLTFEGRYKDGRAAVLHRVKVKGADYLRLMRLFAYCTYDRTREFLEANRELTTWDLFRDFLMRQGSDEVPEEVLGTYRAHFNVWKAYQQVCDTLVEEATEVYQRHMADNPLPSRDLEPEAYRVRRRDFAGWAKDKAGGLAWLLFALIDDRLDVELLDRRFKGDAEAAQQTRADWRALSF